MIRGLYTSALGMTAQMKRMDVVSNNIANGDTTGFKRDMVVTQSFSQELMKRLDDSGRFDYRHDVKIGKASLGLFVDNVVTDFSTGGMQKTEAPLDLAIAGEGFFAISVTDKDGNTTEKYTRDGSFSLLSDGTLITKEGNAVLGQNGVIQLPPNGDTVIDEYGNITVNGEFADKINTVSFENLESLRKYGDNLYDTTDDSVAKDFDGTIIQGFIEKSNISAIKEMVEMISLSRAYEANQKMISMMDTTFGQAVSDIARK